MDELKPCPFCGGKAISIPIETEAGFVFYIQCIRCGVSHGVSSVLDFAAKYWNTRYEPKTSEAKLASTNIFDHREIYPNCTVEVLTNSVTGDVSYGWWRNDTEWEATE